MAEPIHLLYLDRYHLDDALFLQSLARALAKAGREAPPCILVHGSGERAERRLEGEGLIPERAAGVLRVDAPAERAVVERAVRESNRKLVGLLTEAVVAAVGVQGVDRNLLRFTADGAVAAGPVEWLEAVARRGAVPVVSGLARDPAGGAAALEVAPSEVLLALSRAFADVLVVAFTTDGRPGLADGAATRPEVPADRLPEADAAPEPEVLRRVAGAGMPLLLTSPAGLLQEKPPRGTRVVT